MNKRHVTLAITLLVAAAVTAAGCGNADTTTNPTAGKPSATPSRAASPEPTATPESPRQRTTYEVWFTYGDRLFVSRRTEAATPGVGAAALEALFEGPRAEEEDAGVGTAIPAGTELLGLDIDSGTATVDLSSEYESGGGSASMFMRLAQVTYTLTQFSTVEDVAFRIEGETVEVFSAEGIELDGPQTRRDYRDLLPSILVTEPLVGERVSNPVTIAGTADVFEATVSIRILDEKGNVLSEDFTTATCGTGCRGDFTADVSYDVPSEQPGTIEVFFSSPEDGSPQDVIAIPVTLTP